MAISGTRRIASLLSRGEVKLLLIVAYDVADTKRRTKMASELENFGQRVQQSVFECYLEHDRISDLIASVEQHMDFSEDRIRYYFLCGKDENNREYLGKNIVYRDEDYFMI
jgi:CRISPR-associated protein Cas2